MRVFRNIKIPKSFTIAASVFLAVACSRDPARLTDGAAADVFLSEYGKEHIQQITLGPLAFRTQDSESPADTSISVYPLYQSFAKAGLIALENERDLSTGFSGWSDFLAQAQQGVQRVANVKLTEAGAKLGKLQDVRIGDNSFVNFVVGEYEVEKIITNELIDINGEKYRVILGTHVFNVNPALSDAVAQTRIPTDRDRRFRALLKYDAVTSKWKMEGADSSRRDTDFSSKIVPAMVANLRRTGSV